MAQKNRIPAYFGSIFIKAILVKVQFWETIWFYLRSLMLIAAADRESDIFEIVDVLLDWTHVFVHMWDP